MTLEDVVQELRKIRKSRGLTQQQVADSSDLLNTAISNMERGERVTLGQVHRYARALGYRIDFTMVKLTGKEKNSGSQLTGQDHAASRRSLAAR